MKNIVKKVFIIILLLMLFGVFIFAYIKNKKTDFSNKPVEYTKNISMKIESNIFKNEVIPVDYTCNGSKLGIPLKISGVPKEAKSLTLIVDDPDAPNGDYVHWIVWNILPSTTEIITGIKPSNSVEGENSSGENAWVSPCPPSGVHHYIFSLYALDSSISLDQSSNKLELLSAMNDHIIDKVTLVGTYGK